MCLELNYSLNIVGASGRIQRESGVVIVSSIQNQSNDAGTIGDAVFMEDKINKIGRSDLWLEYTAVSGVFCDDCH